ncbi:hypothetical protein K502DRAFT_331084 [Neoconidiobolus thromboides FSU 785]|nr:hypothetical protein K502DRAFT_331084 [Neoconidiobolus thromboides FSU 785]
MTIDVYWFRFLWILVGLGYTVLKQELDKILIEDNKSIEDIEKLDINEIKTKTTQNTLEMLAQIKEHDNLVTEYKIQAKDLTQQIKSIESKINKNKAILASYEDKEAPINKQEIFNCLDSFSESYKNNMIPMTQLEQLINSNGELLIDGGELSKEKKNDMNINEIVKDIMNDMKEWMNQMDKINMESKLIVSIFKGFDNEGDLEKMVNEHREYTKELKRIEKELKHQVDIMEFECKEESVDSKPNENTLFLNKLHNLYNKREGEFNHLQFDMDEIKNEMTGNKNSKKIKVNEFKMSPPSPPFKSLENMNLEFDPFDWL